MLFAEKAWESVFIAKKYAKNRKSVLKAEKVWESVFKAEKI